MHRFDIAISLLPLCGACSIVRNCSTYGQTMLREAEAGKKQRAVPWRRATGTALFERQNGLLSVVADNVAAALSTVRVPVHGAFRHEGTSLNCCRLHGHGNLKALKSVSIVVET